MVKHSDSKDVDFIWDKVINYKKVDDKHVLILKVSFHFIEVDLWRDYVRKVFNEDVLLGDNIKINRNFKVDN